MNSAPKRPVGEVDQYRSDDDGDGILLLIDVPTPVKVVLIDDGAPVETLRPQHEIERLADRRLVPTQRDTSPYTVRLVGRVASQPDVD